MDSQFITDLSNQYKNGKISYADASLQFIMKGGSSTEFQALTQAGYFPVPIEQEDS